MAGSYAGAYGAGGASDALHKLLADKFEREKFSEHQRQAKAREDADAQDRKQRSELAREERVQAANREEARKQQDYEERTERSRQFNRQIEERTTDRQVRIGERADDREAGLEGEDRQRKARIEDREDTQAFQAHLAGIYRQPKPQTERTVRVSYTDPETGQNVEEFMTAEEARARGKFQPATKGAAGMKEKLADLFETERVARDILKRGGEMKWRGVGPLAGRISSIGNDVLGNDPQVAALHADIGNVFSMLSNERFGAALTAQELARATTFLPQKTDPAPVLQQKLNNLIAFAESKRTNMGGQPMPDAGAPTATGNSAAGPAPGTRRMIQGQTAVWDGQGWLPETGAAPAAPAGPPAGAEALFSSRMR
jgi:hypothetical protein